MNRVIGNDDRAVYQPEFDHWHQIDLDGDGQEERLVFLTIENRGGGNNYDRYLLIYRYITPIWIASYIAGVGGKGGPIPLGDEVRLSGSTLTVRTQFYEAGTEGELAFQVLSGGRLEPAAP